MNTTALPRPASQVDGVCEQLAQFIREGSFGEESRLPAEQLLAEQRGVSRKVVREATKRLEQQGMLEMQHGTGIKIVDKAMVGQAAVIEAVLKEDEDAAAGAMGDHLLGASDDLNF